MKMTLRMVKTFAMGETGFMNATIAKVDVKEFFLRNHSQG